MVERIKHSMLDCLDMSSECYNQGSSEYRYILPKPTWRAGTNNSLDEIQKHLILPVAAHYGLTATAGPVEKQERNSSDCSRYGSNSFKSLKDEDRGFLLFIITHGKQLSTRMPHLSEPEALKTFKMLWSEMTPEHKKWYYNNENTIHTAFRDQRRVYHLPSIHTGYKPAQFHLKGVKTGVKKRKEQPLSKRLRTYRYTNSKAYQIQRPFKMHNQFTNSEIQFPANTQSIIKQRQGTSGGSGDASQVLPIFHDNDDIVECQKAVDSINTESEDGQTHDSVDSPAWQYYVDVDTSNDVKEFTNMFYKKMRDDKLYDRKIYENACTSNELSEQTYNVSSTVSIDSKNNKSNSKIKSEDVDLAKSTDVTENATHEDNAINIDTTAGDTNTVIADIQDDKQAVVDSFDAEGAGNETEYVMIPCDVKIARMLGWPVHLLPRVSKDELEGYKVNATRC